MERVTSNGDGTCTVWHGAYGWRTRLKVIQHAYNGSGMEDRPQWFLEILEIRDAPPGRTPFVLHVFIHGQGSFIFECPDLPSAEQARQALSQGAWPMLLKGGLPLLMGAVHADHPAGIPWFYLSE